MSSNPYEDEDAINPSIDMNNDHDRGPPFFKVFKQVGDTLRNGGFCKAPKQSQSQSQSRSMPQSKSSDSAGLGVAVSSEADEVEVAVVVETDSDSETPLEKTKSVTFNDLAEPLIVPEEEETTTTAPTTANSTIATSSTSRSAPTSQSAKSSSSFAISTSIVAILIAVLVSISFVQPQILINLMESSESTAKLMQSEQMQLILNQIKAMMSTASSTCDDCPWIKMTGTAILVAFLAVASDRVKRMTSNVTIVGFVEFLWGAMIYAMIAVGVYYIYN